MKAPVFVKTFFWIFYCSSALFAQEESKVSSCDDYYAQASEVFSRDMDSTRIFVALAQDCYANKGDHGNYLKCLNALSSVYYYQDDFEHYKETCFRAYEEAGQYLEATHPEYGNAINNLNSFYHAIGDFDRSIELLQQALKIKEGNREPGIELAIVYQNLGNAFRSKGEYNRAIELMNKALDFTVDSLGQNHHRIAEIYLNIAQMHRDAERIDTAFHYYEKSLAILKTLSVGKNNRVLTLSIQALHWTAELWIQKGNLAKARQYLSSALLLQKSDKAYRKAFTFELLGQVASNEKDFSTALDYLQQSERLAQSSQKKNTPLNIARRYRKIADVYAQRKQLTTALEKYQAALTVLSPNFTSVDLNTNPPVDQILVPLEALAILSEKAKLCYELSTTNKDQQLLQTAFQTYRTGTQLIRNIRQNHVTVDAKATLSANTVSIYEGAISCALELFEQTQDQTYLQEAFAFAESNKGLLLLESINDQEAKGFAGLPDSLLALEKDLQLNLTYLQKTVLEKKGNKESVKNLEDQIFNLRSDLEKLTQYFEKEYPRYYEAKYQLAPVELPLLQQHLAINNSALLEYFVGEKSIFRFAVFSDRLHLERIDNREKILAATAHLHQHLAAPPKDFRKEDYLDFTSYSHFLYQQLFGNFFADFDNDLTNILIIPDHQLNYLPFEILLKTPAPKDKFSFSTSTLEYLLKQHAISYDYSATLWSRNRDRLPQHFDNDFIGFAPSFKASTTLGERSCNAGELFNLPCSEGEVQSINKLLQGVSKINKAANKENFIALAADSRIIHLATHACIDEENPMFNKIYLTDDYLSNYDLYNLNLHADLAVLSACNTGAGKLIKGEGVMSLARGFINAGCASTVMSMWSVDDCATSEIMIHFYEYLKEGFPKNEALRLAKLNFLEEVNKTKRHPYYWAAFVQFGSVEKLAFTSSSSSFPFLLLSVFLLALFLMLRRFK